MRVLAERAYYRLCLVLGRLLRAAKYSRTRIVQRDGERQVQKHRGGHAPLLVWLGGPLVGILNTGVHVLPQRAWEAREHRVYLSLHGSSIRVEADGMLVLPYLAGATLATILEDPTVVAPDQKRAVELAVVALAAFHRAGFTHGDAMAENVMIDLEADVAHWFDFETMHDPRRPMAWRRADDVRALLATCLLRTPPQGVADTLQLILDVYADVGVTRILASSFAPVLRRPLPFHLGQAALSFSRHQEIARLLRERLGE